MLEVFSLKKIGLMFLATFLIGVFSSILGHYLPENATEAMKSVITADAALVGFIGVITVFLFNSLQNESRRIEDIESRLREKTENFMSGIQNDHTKVLVKKNSDELDLLSTKQELIDQFSNNILKFVVGSVILLIISILWALLGMSLIGNLRFIGIICSVAFMGFAIFLLLLLLDYFNAVFSLLRKIKKS